MRIHFRTGELRRYGQGVGWLSRLSRRWRSTIETRRAIRYLSTADDHMLKDIGASRGGVDWLVRHGRLRPESRN